MTNEQAKIDIQHALDVQMVTDEQLLEYVFSTYDFASLEHAAEKQGYNLFDDESLYELKQIKYDEGYEDGQDSFTEADAKEMLEQEGWLVFKDEDEMMEHVRNEGLAAETLNRNEFIVEVDTPLYKSMLEEKLREYVEKKGALKLLNLLESAF